MSINPLELDVYGDVDFQKDVCGTVQKGLTEITISKDHRGYLCIIEDLVSGKKGTHAIASFDTAKCIRDLMETSQLMEPTDIMALIAPFVFVKKTQEAMHEKVVSSQTL